MARVRGGDNVHAFESLSDLQAIRWTSLNRTLSSLQPDTLRAAEANVLHAEMQQLQ